MDPSGRSTVKHVICQLLHLYYKHSYENNIQLCNTLLPMDHIITNENKYEILPSVVNYDITDPFPIIATTINNFISKRHQQRLVRSYNKLNSKNFNEDIFSKIENFVPKLNIVTGKNFNDLLEQLYSLITKILDTHAPLKKLSRKQRRLKSKPWITKGLLILIKRKQKLHKSHFISGSLIAKNYYKIYSNT